jgi:hypothetical protein
VVIAVFDDTPRQWLRHPETGGYFHCPAEAVDAWKGRGWEESDPPAEPNAAIAEQVAYREQQAASAEANKAADDDDKAARQTKSTKSAAKSEEK